jgi:hypothetical protein
MRVRRICVNFQPEKKRLSSKAVARLMCDVALTPAVHSFTWNRRKGYVNFFFASSDVQATWTRLRATTLIHPVVGRRLRDSTIIVAEGSHGWEDYLLLHHFDSRQPLDRLGKASKKK